MQQNSFFFCKRGKLELLSILHMSQAFRTSQLRVYRNTFVFDELCFQFQWLTREFFFFLAHAGVPWP